MAGIYVHVPFCKVKCNYCDFNSYENQDELVARYFDAVIEEMRYHVDVMERLKIHSVYFGGGTPSYVDSKYILNVLEFIYNNYQVATDAEITLETNPGTLTKSKMLDYMIAGINRVSMGAQSTNETVLKQLGRIHTRDDLMNSLELVRQARIRNVSVDLMFGLPLPMEMENKETAMDEAWAQSLKDIVDMDVQHVSCYGFTPEKSTSLYQAVKRGEYQFCEEQQDRSMYALARKHLQKNGFSHYEISNFAKPGFESRHNLLYWNVQEYLGVGAGAHSFLRGSPGSHLQSYGKFRYENAKTISDYCEAIEQKGKANGELVDISKEEEMREYMMLGYRLLDGISLQAFQERFSTDAAEKFKTELTELQEKALVQHCKKKHRLGAFKLTEKGLDFANQVFMAFV